MTGECRPPRQHSTRPLERQSPGDATPSHLARELPAAVKGAARDSRRCMAEPAVEPPPERCWIKDLGEPGYTTLRPIPVDLVRHGPEDFEAMFTEANLGIDGSDKEDALENLTADILDTFDDLVSVPTAKLGKSLAKEFRVLKSYVART